jgi:hypothetical protein
MRKEAQQSLLDLLIRLVPDWGKEITIIRTRRPTIDRQAAKKLYAMWLDAKNKISDKTFKRPEDITKADIEKMENEGLIKEKKEEIEITAKGVDVIKTMLLGDERSAFDDDGTILDYMTAHANTKPRMRKTSGKRASSEQISGNNWWSKMKIAGDWSQPFRGGEGTWTAQVMDYSNKGPLIVVTLKDRSQRRALFDLLEAQWKILD